MLKVDDTGRGVLQYEVVGRIRRIPIPRTGTTKKGIPWTLGGCLLEVFEAGAEGSAQLYLTTFDTELMELLETIGVGKDVRAMFHVETRERYDGYSVSCILDSVNGLTEGENFIYGKPKQN